RGIHRIGQNNQLPWSFLAHTGLTIQPPHPQNLRKAQYQSAARADEVLCLNVEDLYPQGKRGRITAPTLRRPSAAPDRGGDAGRPSGFTGSPVPPSSFPD
ncbi:hypothetical protein ACFYW6_39380, partial [Streptomyces sp. NPDC002659]